MDRIAPPSNVNNEVFPSKDIFLMLYTSEGWVGDHGAPYYNDTEQERQRVRWLYLRHPRSGGVFIVISGIIETTSRGQ